MKLERIGDLRISNKLCDPNHFAIVANILKIVSCGTLKLGKIKYFKILFIVAGVWEENLCVNVIISLMLSEAHK